MSRRLLYRLIWIPSALVLIGLTAFFLQQPFAIADPSPMTSFVTSDKSLAVSHPGNWKPRQLAAHSTLTRLSFEPSLSVRFVVASDFQGSLMADIAKASESTGENLAGMIPGGEQFLEAAPKKKSPLEKLHETQGQEMEKEYSEYEGGETTKRQIGGQEALVTAFRYRKRAGMFRSQEMVGLRATALSGERRISIVCYCPKDVEARLLPAFEQMIESLQIGQGG